MFRGRLSKASVKVCVPQLARCSFQTLLRAITPPPHQLHALKNVLNAPRLLKRFPSKEKIKLRRYKTDESDQGCSVCAFPLLSHLGIMTCTYWCLPASIPTVLNNVFTHHPRNQTRWGGAELCA